MSLSPSTQYWLGWAVFFVVLVVVVRVVLINPLVQELKAGRVEVSALRAEAAKAVRELKR